MTGHVVRIAKMAMSGATYALITNVRSVQHTTPVNLVPVTSMRKETEMSVNA